jgi:hypothetical protein
VSGKDTKRPELEVLIQFVREGDTVVVHSMDRLARNLDDLRQIVQKLTGHGIRIQFIKESLSTRPCANNGPDPFFVAFHFPQADFQMVFQCISYMKETCLAALATTKHRSLLEPASAGITKKPGRVGS